MKVTAGESLKLGLPGLVELLIKVDPRRTGSAFSMGTQTIASGGTIPVHRHHTQDEVLFVHKGQGRAILEGRAMTVVPGMLVYVPRQTWHGLRNTGTGLLQITWTVVPAGIEEFFRELSRLTSPPDAATLQAIAQRHGIEFRPERGPEEVAAKAGRPHRGRRRRRGGRRHRGRQEAAQAVQSPEQPSPAPRQPSPAPRQPSPAPQQRTSRGGSKPRERFQRRRRVRTVYMGGRWIEVAGEDPIIAPGKERREHRPKDRRGDEGDPGGPLSVPL